MKVKELNQEQLQQLKNNLFYSFRYDEDKKEEFKQYLSKEEQEFLDDVNTSYWDISDDLLFKFYDGIEFVTDDFFCE